MTTKFLLSSDDNTRSGLLKKKIIHYYMANGDATIAEVCKEMNLSIPTVTKLISELANYKRTVIYSTLENKRLAEGVNLVFTGSIPYPAILWA